MERKRILIVDDDKKFSHLLKAVLEKIGAYEVRAEQKATGALAAARDFAPDLIVLDVMMPELDGGEVAAQLRDDETLQHVALVFVSSAVTQEEVAERRGVIGGRLFMSKSAPVLELVEFINRQVGRSERP